MRRLALRTPLTLTLLCLTLLVARGPAAAFEARHADPALRILAPALPAEGLSVSVDARADTAQAASTRVCAGARLRELVQRPQMPDRDRIYRAPLDAQTFLVLYILEAEGRSTLHAHLLAAVAGTHCVDVHFSRPQGPDDGPEAWRAGFRGAQILGAAVQ